MKRFLAVCTTALLAASAVVLGVAAPASAWHSTITSDVKCSTTSAATITWHVQGYDSEETGDVTASTDNIVPVGTTFAGAESKDFTQAITAPGTYTLSVSMHWPSDTATNTGSITVDKSAFDSCYVAPPTPTVSFSYSAVCGSLTLTTVSENVNANWYYGTQAIVDGTRIGSAVLKGSGTKTTVIPFAEDSHGGSVDVDVQTYASTEQDILPAGWALGVSHLITVKTDCQPPIVFDKCVGSTTRPTSTDLNAQGWANLGGTYVDGGMRFNSSEDGYVYIEGLTPVTLSALASVAFNATPDYGGIIFYNDDNSVNVHYEPYYSDPLWTKNPGVLPANGGGQGGPYSGDFSDLLSNPTITSVAFWVNGGHDVTLHSLSWNCQTQNFGLAEVPVIPEPKVVVTHGEFGGAEPSCEVPSVEWTRTETTTTTPYKVIVEDGQYKVVEDTENITTETVTDEETLTVKYEGDCRTEVVPLKPASNDVCGVANDALVIPEGPTGVAYALVGKNIVATLASADYKFGELPEGYVLSEDGLSATFAFMNGTWTDVPCPTTVVTTPKTPLASTGGSIDPLLPIGGSLLLLAGLGLIGYGIRRAATR